MQILYLCGHFNIFIILLHIILLLYMGFVFMKYRADVSLCCSILISYMPLTLISGRLLFMVCINDEKNTNNMWHPVFDWRNIINNVYISLMLFQWWPWKKKIIYRGIQKFMSIWFIFYYCISHLSMMMDKNQTKYFVWNT